MTKAEGYLALVERVVDGKMLRTYADVLINPSCLDIYLKDKKESINVWEDVLTLINKKYVNSSYSNIKKDTVNKMKNIVHLRLKWIKGNWKSPFENNDKCKYICNFANYKLFFSDEAINNALEKVDIKNFTAIKECYEGMENWAKSKGYLEVGPCKKEKQMKDSLGHKYTTIITGTKFLLPATPQCSEKDFLKSCIYYDYPYMKKYNCQIYQLEKPFEFYVYVNNNPKNNEKGSLYIPYECLKNKTIEPAVKRMNEYFRWYYSKKEGLDFHLNLMNSSVFKQLKEDIEG